VPVPAREQVEEEVKKEAVVNVAPPKKEEEAPVKKVAPVAPA